MATNEECIPASSPPSSPLSYAQFHGLCTTFNDIDQILIPVWDADNHLLTRNERTEDGQPIDLFEAAHLDQWTVTSEVADYLSTILDIQPTCNSICGSLDPLLLLHLRLDLPTLYEDHESHMQELIKKSSRITTVSSFKASCNWQDQSPLVPQSFLLNDQSLERLLTEKLEVHQSTAMYLGELILRSPNGPVLCEVAEPSTQITLKREETPLIPIPVSKPPPTSMAEILSDCIIPSPAKSDEVWTAEMEQHVLQMLEESLESTLLDTASNVLQDSIEYDIELLKHSVKPIQELRHTSPLVPITPVPPPEAIDEELESMKKLVLSTTAEADEENSSAAMATVLDELAAPRLADVNRRLAADHLVDIDTTLRVPVLSVSALAISSPWQVSRPGLEQGSPRLQVLRSSFADIQRWSGISKLEKYLHWTPFPEALAIVDHNEQLDAAHLSIFDDFYGDDLLIGSLPLYSSDPCCLLADEDTELLEPHLLLTREREHGGRSTSRDMGGEVDFILSTHTKDTIHCIQATPGSCAEAPELQNMRTLLQKRKLEIDAVAETTDKKRAHMKRAHNQSIPNLLHCGLSRYMSAVGIAAADLARPKYVPVDESVDKSACVPDTSSTAQNNLLEKVILPVPLLGGHHENDMQIVVSLKLVTERSLMVRLQQALPRLSLIEREITISSAQAVSPPNDACLAISPTEAIVLTTLQRLRQRPLPGQATRTGVRAMLERCASRFEELLVLVSEANNGSGTDSAKLYQALDNRDCEVFSELIAWSSSLQTSIKVIYVPGGEVELSGWICGLVGQSSKSCAPYRLAQEESMWERFLCLAGLNAFAAQAVLARIKSCSAGVSLHDQIRSSPPLNTTCGNLAHVVAMAPSARKAFLTNMLPDCEVASALGEILDAPWFRNLTVHCKDRER